MRESIVRDWELWRLMVASLFSGGVIAVFEASVLMSLVVGMALAVYACYVTRERVA